MKTNVLYLTWGEDLLTSGILENQVINQLITTRRVFPQVSYSFLCAMPVFWKKRHRAQAQILHEKIDRLEKAGIHVKVVYYWLPVRARYMAIVLHPLFIAAFFFWLKQITNICRRQEIHLIHARAYTGAIVAAAAKKLLRLKVPLVFDTRGLYVDELLQLGFLREGSWWHRQWKRAERTTYACSASIITVSEPFSEYVRQHFSLPADKVETIFTSVDTKIFSPAEKVANARTRRLKRSAPVLVYCGDLGGSSWHSTISLFTLFEQVRHKFGKATLLIISPASRESIDREVLTHFPDRRNELMANCRFMRTYNARETAAALSQADFGVFSYHDSANRGPRHLQEIVLGSKTGEYLAAGLPILVNHTAKAAAAIVRDHRLGIAYNIGDVKSLHRQLGGLVKQWPTYSQRSRKYALKYFAAASIARSHRLIYEKLSPPSKQ